MNDPKETMERFKIFTENIKNEKFRVNFVLEVGYLRFISDLEDIAIELSDACYEIRQKYDCVDKPTDGRQKDKVA
jgi:hypothetical protein